MAAPSARVLLAPGVEVETFEMTKSKSLALIGIGWCLGMATAAIIVLAR
jgi:hypothetical protein